MARAPVGRKATLPETTTGAIPRRRIMVRTMGTKTEC
jgi:hypothetical protein